MTDHEQIIMTRHIPVDIGMKPIIEALWNLQILTEYSCEDNLGLAYILFPKMIDVKFVCSILSEFGIPYYMSKREDKWGGGASVHFYNKDIYKIMCLFINMKLDCLQKCQFNDFSPNTDRNLKKGVIVI